MKKYLILKITIASILAVTLIACGKEQETSVPTEVLSEDIPQDTSQKAPQETPEENAEEAPDETLENMSENQEEEYFMDVYPASEEELGRLEKIADAASTPYLADSVLETAVCESGKKILNGEKSIEEGVAEIKQKLAIYMAE